MMIRDDDDTSTGVTRVCLSACLSLYIVSESARSAFLWLEHFFTGQQQHLRPGGVSLFM